MIYIATLFLILVSDNTIAILGFANTLKTISLSLLRCVNILSVRKVEGKVTREQID